MDAIEFPVADMLSDTGKARENNEDQAFWMENEGGALYGVADGMGGHAGGERASSLARAAVERVWPEAGGIPEEGIEDLLKRMVLEADRAIVEAVQRDMRYYGMGTTLVLGAIREGVLTLAHVGDSRAYLLRCDALRRLTVDQTEAQQLVEAGQLTPEQAEESPYRHRLTQAVGRGMRLEVPTCEEALRPGDRVLLCSDGLTDMVPEGEIRGLLGRAKTPSEACRTLVDAANAAGGEDNISVVAVYIPGGG